MTRAFERAGYETYMLARYTGEAREYEEIEGVRIMRIGKGMPRAAMLPVPGNLLWRHAIEQACEKLKPSLVMPREIMLSAASARAARQIGAKTIIDMAENYPAAMKLWKKYNSNFLSRLTVHTLKLPERAERKAVALADGIITVCDEQNERLAGSYRYSESRMQVVHNTPELAQFGEPDLNFNEGGTVFCHHGWLTAEKSVMQFLKGFLLAAERDRSLRFILAGDGDCLPDYKTVVASSKARESVVFTGKYNFVDLKLLLSRSDIGALPYEDNAFNAYTIHNKIFDYFAAGKPVLTSSVAPLRRLIEETRAGISSDARTPEEWRAAILEAAATLKTRSYAKTAFLAHAEKYNWEQDARNMLAFTERILS